jgi:hypothetical protein
LIGKKRKRLVKTRDNLAEEVKDISAPKTPTANLSAQPVEASSGRLGLFSQQLNARVLEDINAAKV